MLPSSALSNMTSVIPEITTFLNQDMGVHVLQRYWGYQGQLQPKSLRIPKHLSCLQPSVPPLLLCPSHVANLKTFKHLPQLMFTSHQWSYTHPGHKLEGSYSLIIKHTVASQIRVNLLQLFKAMTLLQPCNQLPYSNGHNGTWCQPEK